MSFPIFLLFNSAYLHLLSLQIRSIQVSHINRFYYKKKKNKTDVIISYSVSLIRNIGMCYIPVKLKTVENNLFSKFFKFLHSDYWKKKVIFLNFNPMSMCVCVLSGSVMYDSLQPPALLAHQAPLSMGFFRQEYLPEGLPCPPPRGLPDPGIELVSPVSLALAGRLFTPEPLNWIWGEIKFSISKIFKQISSVQ